MSKALELQPSTVVGYDVNERNAFIVSMRDVDGTAVIVSRYGDDVWQLSGGTTNTREFEKRIDFNFVPHAFRDATKAIIYRFKCKGRAGGKRPGAMQLVKTLWGIKSFVEYLGQRGLNSFIEVTPQICAAYVLHCKTRGDERNYQAKKDRSLSSGSLANLFSAVELIYEISPHTDSPMPEHPWPDSSADHLSGYGRCRRSERTKTPLMPDEVFSALFQKAWSVVQQADYLLDLRQVVDDVKVETSSYSKATLVNRRNRSLESLGWQGGYSKLLRAILDIRTACYIVIASLSGCRNHELAYLHTNSYRCTEDDSGERFWWMHSRSTKTDEGYTEWMIPEAAVTALKVMDRWAAPYQEKLRREIEAYREANPLDPRIAEASAHLDAIFMSESKTNVNRVRTLPLYQSNKKLKDFVRDCGLTWELSSHQFRRKFANYAARSKFGDLRYLREHFKHWSMDMSLGYALNEAQEMALYLEIEDELQEIKEGVVEQWIHKSESLAGGYGSNIVNWRSREENIVLFKTQADMVRSIAQSTAIRSNGHAWCTADDDLCVGNSLERTRCGDGCNNAVIGRVHAPIYQGLYDQLKTLEDCEDIGEGGKARVGRDLDRCRVVLKSLGVELAGDIR